MSPQSRHQRQTMNSDTQRKSKVNEDQHQEQVVGAVKLATDTQMDHYELSSELGKVVQPLKKMGVDVAAHHHHHHQSKLNEMSEQMARKEARCSDIASNSGTDSNRTIPIVTVEASPG